MHLQCSMYGKTIILTAIVFSFIPPTGNTWRIKIQCNGKSVHRHDHPLESTPLLWQAWYTDLVQATNCVQLTFPVRDTSPVMATFCLMGLFSARDMRADTIVTPALGPSFGTAPSGTWRWTGDVWSKALSGYSSPRKFCEDIMYGWQQQTYYTVDYAATVCVLNSRAMAVPYIYLKPRLH